MREESFVTIEKTPKVTLSSGEPSSSLSEFNLIFKFTGTCFSILWQHIYALLLRRLQAYSHGILFLGLVSF